MFTTIIYHRLLQFMLKLYYTGKPRHIFGGSIDCIVTLKNKILSINRIFRFSKNAKNIIKTRILLNFKA